MPEPTFETELRARLHDVLDSAEGPHPVWAEAPAARMGAEPRRPDRWPIRLLGIAALLAIGSGVLSVAGSWRPGPAEPTPPVSSAPTVPDVLRGQFVAQLAVDPRSVNPYPFYFVDLEDSVLLHGPGSADDPAALRAERGTSADWAGRLVQFTPIGAGAAAVVIQAPPPCGEGRYVVRYDEAQGRGDAQRWSLFFTQPQDPCAERVAILAGGSDEPPIGVSASPDGSTARSPAPTGRMWAHKAIQLTGGTVYASWSFTEPFHFRMPDRPTADPSPPTSAWTWLAPGTLRLSSVWWIGKFYDDEPLPTCDRALPDIPSTPAAFESWLRTTGRSIDRSVEVEVDGRTATRFDASDPGSDCPGTRNDRFFGRWYLIPTGDDTILFNVYGDTETELTLADDIVRSMTFD